LASNFVLNLFGGVAAPNFSIFSESSGVAVVQESAIEVVVSVT
jgi:hypothetical protein